VTQASFSKLWHTEPAVAGCAIYISWRILADEVRSQPREPILRSVSGARHCHGEPRVSAGRSARRSWCCLWPLPCTCQAQMAPAHARLSSPRRTALYLRSVCWFKTAFRGLKCHPLTCMLLKIRLSVDSIPSALTTFKINNLDENTGQLCHSLYWSTSPLF
jgi:hypothetical protein